MTPNDSNPSEPVIPSPLDAAPPPAPNEPSSTLPPIETLQSPMPSSSSEPVSLGTATSMPPGSTPANVVPKKRFPIKMLVVFLVILTLLGVGAAVVNLVLPKLGGGLGGEVNLTWWGLWEDETVVAPLIAEYQQQHPNVKITYVKQSQEDYRERLTSSLAQGNGPDIFRIHNSWVPMFRSTLYPMPQSVMSFADFTQTFFPAATADLTNGVQALAMPLEFDSIGLYINEEIFETYLKSPPETWTDLETLAKELTIIDETGAIRQSGVAMGNTTNMDHWPEVLALLMLQNNVDMANPKGPLAEDALDFFTRFTRVHRVWNETLPPSTIAFAGGKVAMYFGPSWRAHEIRKQNPSLRFRVVPMPQLPKETEKEPSVYYATYWAEGVWSESKGKDQAWDFLKFMSSKESLQKFYQNASGVAPERKFGEPYPRVDMVESLATDPVVGTFVFQGREAKSWYLASRTFDGPTGINSLINKYFEDAVNLANKGNIGGALNTAASGVTQVLTQYGLLRQTTP